MSPKKKSGKKTKQKSKKAAAKRSAPPKKKSTVSSRSGRNRVARKKSASRSRRATPARDRKLLAAPPSPDDMGLSNAASADSESVDELLDEGNAFEAGVVSGLERADRSEGKEVRTKEVPEDDVPDEYLDKDA